MMNGGGGGTSPQTSPSMRGRHLIPMGGSSKQPHEEDLEVSKSSSNDSKHYHPPPLKAKNSSLQADIVHGDSERDGDDDKNNEISAACWKAVTACLLYSFCSVSMILTNKSLASRYVCS